MCRSFSFRLNVRLAALAMPAHAAALAGPEVYFGTGNGNVDWTVTTVNDVELGLDTLIRLTIEVAPAGNVYNVAVGDPTVAGKTGSLWGFAFSAINQSGLLRDLTLSLTITDALRGTVTFDPTIIADTAGTDGLNTAGGSNGCFGDASSACAPASRTGLQNAEAPSFNFIDAGYNSALNNTFLITLTATDVAGFTNP
jgi:hypothetical protein